MSVMKNKLYDYKKEWRADCSTTLDWLVSSYQQCSKSKSHHQSLSVLTKLTPWLQVGRRIYTRCVSLRTSAEPTT